MPMTTRRAIDKYTISSKGDAPVLSPIRIATLTPALADVPGVPHLGRRDASSLRSSEEQLVLCMRVHIASGLSSVERYETEFWR